MLFRETDPGVTVPAPRSEPDPVVRTEADEQPLLAPVTPSMSWASIHAMSQTSVHESYGQREARAIMDIRRTATVRPGTRMIKLLTATQVTAYLHGRRPNGFCYRSYDLATLRTAADLAVLLGDVQVTSPADQAIFGLRWRAMDPSEYHLPFALEDADVPGYAGLTSISPHHRVGPPVLGTGFAPSRHHLIPEFVTADLADLPMPAGTSLVAFAPDGTEVSLYLYVPEQRAWTRMFGPQYRHLVAGIPDVAMDQEYVQATVDHQGGPALLGEFDGRTYEALGDPPHEYRVLARVRAARYPVQQVVRRTRYVQWRDVTCTVVRAEGDWLRLRLCRPDRESAATLAAQVVERGVYEVWAATGEVTAVRRGRRAVPAELATVDGHLIVGADQNSSVSSSPRRK